jgi:hypothetical protein
LKWRRNKKRLGLSWQLPFGGAHLKLTKEKKMKKFILYALYTIIGLFALVATTVATTFFMAFIITAPIHLLWPSHAPSGNFISGLFTGGLIWGAASVMLIGCTLALKEEFETS